MKKRVVVVASGETERRVIEQRSPSFRGFVEAVGNGGGAAA